MTERTCLYCGIGEAEVKSVRARDGYTLGCGIESNTEAGFDYEELSPRHRWAPWRDDELKRMGIKPDAYEKYHTETMSSIQYAACDDLMRGHNFATEDIYYGKYKINTAGQCMACGQVSDAGKETNA